jgi:hypothetical protein
MYFMVKVQEDNNIEEVNILKSYILKFDFFK